MRYIVDNRVFNNARDTAEFIVLNTKCEQYEAMIKECADLISKKGALSRKNRGIIFDLCWEQYEKLRKEYSWMSEGGTCLSDILQEVVDEVPGKVAIKIVKGYIKWLYEMGEREVAVPYEEAVAEMEKETFSSCADVLEYYINGLDIGGHDVFYGFDVEAIR